MKTIDEANFAGVSKIAIDKACEWLETHVEYWVYDDGYMDVNAMLKDFRKAMEGQDMKTIKERAKEFGRSGDSLASFAGDLERGYLKGATDQKAIDDDHLREVKKMVIDKACRWLKRRYPEVNIDDLRNALKG